MACSKKAYYYPARFAVSAGDQFFQVRPRAAGITLDAAATVEQATARGFNPFSVVTDLIGSRDIEPIILIDQDLLQNR